MNDKVGFEDDLTPHLNQTVDNVTALRVDNSMVPAGRWHAGTGK